MVSLPLSPIPSNIEVVLASIPEHPLEILAKRLSNEYSVSQEENDNFLLLDLLKRDEKTFKKAYQQFSLSTHGDKSLSYGAEWLLENYFVLQQAMRQVREDLPAAYYQELPKLQNGVWENYPRVYALSREIIDYANCQVDIDQLVQFLKAFQSSNSLTMGEIWAFPTMLRLGILSNLAQALLQLPDNEIAISTSNNDDSIVRYCISSLRLLAVINWKNFFERVSFIEEILQSDPAGIYNAMDFTTRNSYRKVIEQLGRLSKHSESVIAEQVIELSQQAIPDSRQAHIGYYLIGDGRQQLETMLAYHPSGGTALGRWLLAHPSSSYLFGIASLISLLMAMFVYYAVSSGGTFLQILAVGLLSFLPATALATGLVNWVVSTRLSPRLLPRMDYEEGIASDYRAMVVIPSFLSHAEEIDSLLQQLELHYLRNLDPALFFALLTDFLDAPSEQMPEDEALIRHAEAGIEALNTKYPREIPPFYLFHRQRQWNEAQNSWIGWERKRGKLVEFNHLLRGKESTSYSVKIGDLTVLARINYVITLDADTILPEGAAQALVATLAHPLNRAVYDPILGKVTAGYSILQPRIEIKPMSANQSHFTEIFAGDIGLDIYTHAVSDVYQDLFGEGSYVGKGIYDVDILELSLANRIPENSLLSHDLFEGIHARVALVSDILFLEEYPSSYLGNTRRLHRWIRGDWQLLPWLLPRIPNDNGGKMLPNTFTLLDRWKILDNLRRSLVAPALFALLLVAWSGLIGSALVWTGLAFVALAFPFFVSLFTGLYYRPPTQSLITLLHSRRNDAMRALFALIFLPYEAVLTLNAIIVTLVRLFITRKSLLQWTTAAQTARFFKASSGSEAAWREMLVVPVMLGVIIVILLLLNPLILLFVAPVLTLWLFSPQIAYWLSLRNVQSEAKLSQEQEKALNHLARQTWLFFEQTVGPEDHWLPPDHFQVSPQLVAHRTSPTNIGLLLVSTLAAYDFGYIGLFDLIARLQASFETLDKLEHYRGHLLNWYDTQSLASLAPRYVSTVDSGNLAGSLIVIEQACLAFPDALVIRPQQWQGLLDTLGLLEERLDELYDKREDKAISHLRAYTGSLRQTIDLITQSPNEWATLIAWLNNEAWESLSQLIIAVLELEGSSFNAEILSSLRISSERFHYHLTSMQRDMNLLLPWLASFSDLPALFHQPDLEPSLVSLWQGLVAAAPTAPRLSDIETVCEDLNIRLQQIQAYLERIASSSHVRVAQNWANQLGENLNNCRNHVHGLLMAYNGLANRAENHFQAMDFAFLFNQQRKVFHIGYNVANDKLDDNFYDLLASEARLASLLAIAKHEVPSLHWLHLGRAVTDVKHQRTLLSWSGTMFEYLMPNLFTKTYEQTFLSESCRLIVEAQIAYAGDKNVPWGISESSYYAFDSNLTYQYYAFGVPGLGFKRGLGEDLVITPYASLLALAIRPQAVRKNMDDLDALKMRGLYGYYEALDFTPSRLPLHQKSAIVQSYMAHHQGMILISLSNYLFHNTMIQRFHADSRIKSLALLLQEKIPNQAPLEILHPGETVSHAVPQSQMSIAPWSLPNDTTVPQVHVLSNGRYTSLITNAGGGFSQWKGIGLSRWEADSTLDASGNWIYLQDLDSSLIWSACFQPTAIVPNQQEINFYPHQAEFQRRDNDISVKMLITVAANEDVEIRQLSIVNHSSERRRIKLSSYGEVLLAPQTERHPAFSNLFIESEYVAETNMLLFHRRTRTPDEGTIYLGHLLMSQQGAALTGDYEGNRLTFLGRGQTNRNPALGFSKTVGLTLDPIMALSQEIELEAYGSVQVAFLTLVAPSRQEAIELAEMYQNWSMLEHAFETSRRETELALRESEIGTAELIWMQQLLSLLIYPHAALRASAKILNANSKGQSSLWAYGISGDSPILLLLIRDVSELYLVLEALQAHSYWRSQGITIDLAILNLVDSSYSQELHSQVHRIVGRSKSGTWLNRRGGVFIGNADQIGKSNSNLLQTAARVILDGKKGSIAEQLPPMSSSRLSLPRFTATLNNFEQQEESLALLRPNDLAFDNGWGGFSPNGREYQIYLEAGQWTPAPWVNVIANKHFGFLVSEAGAGYTWSENSSENRLSPWSNDAVSDRPGEALYLRDEESANVWSPMLLPIRDNEAYLVRHGAGYSVFEHHSQGLKQTTSLFAEIDQPIKIIKLRLENTWNRPRRVTVTYYVEWVLGINRAATQPYIVSEYDHDSGALLARNVYNTEFGERVAFLAANKAPHGLTADRNEFLGRAGDISKPAALGRIGLAGTVEVGLDPCAVIQLHVDLPIGGSEEVFFLLGEGENRENALELIRTFQDASRVEAAWQAVNAFWNKMLGTVAVKTPDTAMNIMLNHWLLYQALSSRIWGRTGFYQSSGAFGFRDQLQDVMALLLAMPLTAREHILRAASHQFEAGDVLHWWHSPSERGVRTRFSDDLLWLPFVVAEYIETTGDRAILDEEVPFLRAAELKRDEEERYDHFETTTETYSLYEHCLRAIKRGSTAGVHGLPLMGTGDWNDGMNRVGSQGRGESVWLGWFLYSVLTKFAVLCDERGDAHLANSYNEEAKLLKIKLAAAWDGKWYRRAYYDDGTALGAANNLECQIDSIAQSWALLSGAAEPARVEQAMEAVAEQLIQEDEQLLLLFTPPFDKTSHDPGYIKGYPPGIRENGGQYTHAAIWTVWAFAQMGQGNRAGDLFRFLNPISHSDSYEKAARYRVDPYVVAADVYSVAPHIGRGGWTWYTGSASWMYRLGIEAILGLKCRGNRLYINPCIPDNWEGFELRYRHGKAQYTIQVRNPQKLSRGLSQIKVDGVSILENYIILANDGEYLLDIELTRD